MFIIDQYIQVGEFQLAWWGAADYEPIMGADGLYIWMTGA